MAYSIGYDLGSSFVKAALLDIESGKALAGAQFPEEEMPISAPNPGWAEQSPELWWTSVCSVTRDLLAKSGVDPADLDGLLARMTDSRMVVERIPADSPAYRFLI